jgi:hypothetical protein
MNAKVSIFALPQAIASWLLTRVRIMVRYWQKDHRALAAVLINFGPIPFYVAVNQIGQAFDLFYFNDSQFWIGLVFCIVWTAYNVGTAIRQQYPTAVEFLKNEITVSSTTVKE